MRAWGIALWTVLVFGVGVWSQEPTPNAGQASEAPKQRAADVYTDLDKAELQILALQEQIRSLSDQLGECRTQLAPLVSRANAEAMPRLRDEAFVRIEGRHPGHIINRATGLLERKPPDPPPAQKKK